MEEAIQDFEGPREIRMISLRSDKASRQTGFVIDRAPKEIADEVAEKRIAINGLPASSGVIEGSASVITSHKDLTKIRSGTILVCPYMSPALTITFSKIKGIVTDYGGTLAPAATIAREHGIPAVVGTSMATESIHNGDIIRLDGTEGRVEIISRAH